MGAAEKEEVQIYNELLDIYGWVEEAITQCKKDSDNVTLVDVPALQRKLEEASNRLMVLIKQQGGE